MRSNRILMRGANAVSAHMRRGKVADAGPAHSLAVTAGRRLRRAGKSTTNLLSLEADISSLANSGTHQVNIIAKLVSVGLLLGNSANWGTSARIGRARETTADLLRSKTVDKVAVEGGAEELRGTASMGFKNNLNARRGVLDGSDRGHRPIVVSDAAAASGGAG